MRGRTGERKNRERETSKKEREKGGNRKKEKNPRKTRENGCVESWLAWRVVISTHGQN